MTDRGSERTSRCEHKPPPAKDCDESVGAARRHPGRLFVALDFPDPDQARLLAAHLEPLGVGYKIGLELFLAAGPGFVAELAERYHLFLDLKFHDIPNTVAAAVAQAARLKVRMINIHASGGREMMIAARNALEGLINRPLLLAVTVLTSMGVESMLETGQSADIADRVVRLSVLAARCGLDGAVCSPLEIEAVKKEAPPGFVTVTPGIRPAGVSFDDQARAATPAAVTEAGGDYLVVGRPITRACDPYRATKDILAEMGVLS